MVDRNAGSSSSAAVIVAVGASGDAAEVALARRPAARFLRVPEDAPVAPVGPAMPVRCIFAPLSSRDNAGAPADVALHCSDTGADSTTVSVAAGARGAAAEAT